MIPPKAPCARCDTCPLLNQRFVPTYLPEDPDGTILISQAPGYNEVRAQKPFVGRSGELLKSEYRRAGGDYDRAILTNVVACEPPADRPPTQNEIDHCAPRLMYELAKYKPTRKVVLGQIARRAVEQLCHEEISEGSWNAQGSIAVTHPAAYFRNPGILPKFRRALERAVRGPGGDPIEEALQQEPEVTVITTKGQLVSVLAGIADGSWVAFDLETNQTRWYKARFGEGEFYGPDSVLCLAFTTGVGYGWIVPDYLIYDCPGVPEILSAFFDRVKKIGHNGKFDVLFTHSVGIRTSIDFDTMIAHYCLDETPGTHGLKELASTEFGVVDYEAKLTLKYLRSKNDVYSKIPETPLFTYAVWDVCTTIALAMKFKRELVRQRLWEHPFNALLMPVQRALTSIERRGVRVDVPYLQLWKERFLERAEILRRRMAAYAEDESFNPGSHVQMKKLLFGKLGLPMTVPMRQSSGRGMTKEGSTGKDALKQLAGLHPIIELIGEYRTCLKMVRSYIDNLLKAVDQNDRVHTSYSLTATLTGRLASRSPALQQIPKGRSINGQIVRAAFIPRPGYVLIDCDYAQAELRVFAAETGDPFLKDVYERDLDLHEQVVRAQWGPIEEMSPMEYENYRFIAKIFNFGWMYGGGADMLTGVVPNPAEASAFVKRYEANMPVAAQWRRMRAAEAQQRGWVQSRLGRRRRANGGELKPTEAINAPIQSGASDCTASAAERLDREGYDVLLLVHDQLVVEAPEARAEEVLAYVIQVMVEEAGRIYPEVPWKADGKIKRRWAKELTDAEYQDWLHGIGTEEDTRLAIEADKVPIVEELHESLDIDPRGSPLTVVVEGGET